MLWTFEQISFIPHSTYGSFDELSPVFLCNKDLLPHSFDLSSFNTLFNLDGKIPSDYQHFKKIVEFVRPQENYRTKSREHYLFYKKNYKILNILECNDNFIETKQDTIILILQNKKD